MTSARTVARIEYSAKIPWSNRRKRRTLLLPASAYNLSHPELIKALAECDLVSAPYLVHDALYTIMQTLSLGEPLSDRAEAALEACLGLKEGWAEVLDEGFCPSCYVPTLDDADWEEDDDTIYDASKDLYLHESGQWFRHTGGSGLGGRHTCSQCAEVGADERSRGISDRFITHPSVWPTKGIRPLKP